MDKTNEPLSSIRRVSICGLSQCDIFISMKWIYYSLFQLNFICGREQININYFSTHTDADKLLTTLCFTATAYEPMSQ